MDDFTKVYVVEYKFRLDVISRFEVFTSYYSAKEYSDALACKRTVFVHIYSFDLTSDCLVYGSFDGGSDAK